MTIEIQWKDRHPETGAKRLLRAEKWGKQWRFSWRTRKYERWLPLEPTRAMWEYVYDSLQRRYRRREGVDDEDVDEVRRLLSAWPQERDEEE